MAAKLAADVDPVSARHHPVEDHEPWRIGFLQDLPSFAAVLDRYDAVTRTYQRHFEEPPGRGVVFGNQNFHSMKSSLIPIGGNVEIFSDISGR